MIGLADCNNFYASCERLFRPELKGVPILVLSNNDACVVSRSSESKALGIAMGIPYFQIQEEIKKHKIVVFSSHYSLYGDLSARVMTNLARFSPNIEVYSIDECFFGLTGFSHVLDYAKEIRATVIKNTGIPITLGIAPTKVLAKVANKTAKKNTGIMVISNEDEIYQALKNYPVEDLWGVGRQHSQLLQKMSVKTALEFRSLPIEWIKKNMSIVGVRMWRELWGQSCIPLKEVLDPKKTMCTSRGFGQSINNINELYEAITNYTSRLASKLRREKLCANLLSIRLLTNRFKINEPQLYPSISIALPHPVNNSSDLVKTAVLGLNKIYKKGYKYQKVEVLVSGLIPESEVQLSLFDSYNPKKNTLSKVLDSINLHYGQGTIRFAAEGVTKKWDMKQDYLSPNYTTDWNDIIKVR